MTASEEVDADTVERLCGTDVGHCYQCGKCSAGCPVADRMDLLPHQVLCLEQFLLYIVLYQQMGRHGVRHGGTILNSLDVEQHLVRYAGIHADVIGEHRLYTPCQHLDLSVILDHVHERIDAACEIVVHLDILADPDALETL